MNYNHNNTIRRQFSYSPRAQSWITERLYAKPIRTRIPKNNDGCHPVLSSNLIHVKLAVHCTRTHKMLTTPLSLNTHIQIV